MTKPFRVLALSAFAVAAAFAVSQDTWTLKRVPKKNETASYSMIAESTNNPMGMPITIKATVTHRVTDVNEAGYTVEVSHSDVRVAAQGMEQTFGSLPPTTLTMSSAGDIIGMDLKQPSTDAWRSAALTTFRYPVQPVKLGEEWSVDIPGKGRGEVAMKATYKAEAIDKVGNVDALKIRMAVKETEGAKPASIDGHVWIRPADGEILKTEVNWTDVPIEGVGPISAKVVLVRS